MVKKNFKEFVMNKAFTEVYPFIGALVCIFFMECSIQIIPLKWCIKLRISWFQSIEKALQTICENSFRYIFRISMHIHLVVFRELSRSIESIRLQLTVQPLIWRPNEPLLFVNIFSENKRTNQNETNRWSTLPLHQRNISCDIFEHP